MSRALLIVAAWLLACQQACGFFVGQMSRFPVTHRRSAPSPRMLFGGADDKPMEDPTSSSSGAAGSQPPAAGGAAMPGMPDMSQEELQMAMDFRDKMNNKLSTMSFESTSLGVTVRYDGQAKPMAVEISEAAFASGPVKIAEGMVAASKMAQADAQKGIQEVMVEMQKALMAELQTKYPGK
eukprot:CAMPEP_0118965700 /NCGR_PEP_ID=MMETSP1173-20130426/3236_1 /TAXON_ID=1034831 /ORGANISM="Rhizochromulina marina cf, Strain CCMP1243" /LENGTH=180 /DNA_ID=CAMNT_0006914361 /DNA_START=52 /DNA_END=594 /DNA_ORIENTATION=-